METLRIKGIFIFRRKFIEKEFEGEQRSIFYGAQDPLMFAIFFESMIVSSASSNNFQPIS